MTDAAVEQYRQPFGIGDIISETFSILTRKFLWVLVLSCVPTLVALVLTWLLVGASFAPENLGPNADAAILPVGLTFARVIAVVLLWFAAYGVTVALIVQLAYDAKLGRAVRPTHYVLPALTGVPFILVLMLPVGFLVGFGLMLLLVPGLWIYAVFCVFVPAILFDRSGFGALGRSMSLTREYRWPIVALTIIMWVIGVLISEAGSLIVDVFPDGFILGPILLAVLYGITYGISGISVALTYARLREIKEGANVQDLVSVFE